MNDPLASDQSVRRLDEGAVSDKDRRESHEAMENRHKLRHGSHFHALRKYAADGATNSECENQNSHRFQFESENRREQRDRHADHAIKISTARSFLITEATQAKDE